MAYAFTLSGRSSELTSVIYPPIDFTEGTYEIGLLNLETFNSIPNITPSNNKFPFFVDDTRYEISFPTGTYELDDINTYIQNHLPMVLNHVRLPKKFVMQANTNTMKTELFSPFDVDFTESGTIASVLGFSQKRLLANTNHVSEEVVNIFGISIIRVECNLAKGSFLNGEPTHSIYEFFPTAPPGYRITQAPSPPIYFPLINIQSLSDITIRIVDQNGKLIPFQEEVITVRIHIRHHGSYLL